MSGGEAHEDVARWPDATDEHTVSYSRKEEVMMKSMVCIIAFISVPSLLMVLKNYFPVLLI